MTSSTPEDPARLDYDGIIVHRPSLHGIFYILLKECQYGSSNQPNHYTLHASRTEHMTTCSLVKHNTTHVHADLNVFIR